MENILNLITLDVQNEHDLEHDFSKKPNFSEPKIYDADGDLEKRWYVYFSYKDPKTGRLKRMKNIYGKVNSHKTKEARYYLLSVYKRRLLRLLKAGYNPFENNTELYKKHHQETTTSPPSLISGSPVESVQGVDSEYIKPLRSTKPPQKRQKAMELKAAIDFALKLKTNVVSDRTLSDYRNQSGGLLKWLDKNRKDIKTIDELTKGVIVEFLNEIQLKTSARNRNNFRTCFSSVFQVLEDNEVVRQNPIKNVTKLKTNPKRNKTYSQKQQREIFEYLEKEDPNLLLFIKFVSYNLLRPKEVCRLRIKDINLDDGTLQFRAKNKVLKTKLIPSILMEELPDLSVMEGDLLLFTKDGIGGKWKATLESRRGYFTDRFKKVVKDHFGFNENHGLYSFRHTFITKLYRSLVKHASPFSAKSYLMQITGHSSMAALEKYLRDVDAELPKDYSNLLK
ncbi:site-specific integrase [Hyunsoonleella flava]|uniref:Site-specific integrase n=1 Tax=Hyunsoonleella flava TaxID=2527939 RepID=A0A4Q9FC16_9FLAO|nr:tyrosine-type recombinase/integrase [Hyunsoonleella flava]TBN02750.1 site-specific integrase [Hyunsoonleella flava]